MKPKKWFLAFLTLAFAIVFSFAVVSCGKPETSSSSSSGPMTDGSEIGVYYYDAGGTEYQISLGDDYQVLFLVKDANKAGVYALEGDALTFTFAQGESEELSATLGGNIITLNYAGSEMRFYKKIFYDVTFASEGVGDSVVSVVNGKTVAQPEDPVRSGYTFIGWYADEAFTQPYFFGTPVTSSITVYGCWGQVIPGQSEFTVGFDLNYEGAPDMESVQTIGATLYKLPEAEREGYEFVGWWSSMYDSAEQLTCQYTAGTVLAESTTLYAVWKETGAAIASPAVSVSATAVSWSGVQGASYTIEITGPDGFTPVSETTAATLYNLSFADAPAGDYTIKVTVTTSAGSAETVRYYKNRALARVSLFTVTETSTLIFTPVENAERYYITVNCGNDAHSHEHFALGNSTYYNFANCEMQEGGITFTVTAEADGWASSTSRAFVYNRELAQVGGFYFDEATETLYWDPVPDAASYVVSVSCGDPSHSHSYVDIGNRTSYSLKDCTPSEDGVVVSVYPRTKGYNVPVAATYTYNKTTLATPHELRIEEGALLKWSDVGAESYVIMIGNVEYTSAVNSFDLSGVLKNVGDYTVKVRAIGTSASVNSLWSDAFDVRYAAMYGTLSYSQSVVSWRYVVGAVSYNVKVNDGEAFSVAAGLNYAEVTLTKEGYNTIAVSFTDEDGNVSEWATIEVFANVITFDSLGGTSVPSQYKAVGDKITLPESSKTGQVFVGWYNVPGGGEVNGAKYTDEIFAEASSITLFAAWEASPYTAQYDAGAGSTTAPSATVYYEKPFAFEVPEIDDTRFVFMGWYSQPDGTGVRYTDEGGASLVVWPAAKDMVVYAYWAEVFAFIETTAKNGEPSYAVTQGPDIGVMTNIRVPAYYNGVLVSDVYSGAFSNCKNLVSIDIPDSVETIGATTDATANGPFGGCSLLQAVNIYAVEGNHTPRYMSVDGVLFDNNETTNTLRLAYFPVAKTGEYRLPDGVEELPLKSFASMKITAITIPSSVTIIGEDAFYNCKNLTTVIFESAASGEEAKPLTIAKDAFRSCVALRSVTLPNRLSENSAIDIFSGCTKLLEINVEKGNAYYSSVNGLLCDSTGSTVLYCPLGVSGEYTIPNGITAIGANAFQSRTQITSLIIPDYVTAIGEYAFAGCTRLTSVTFRGTAAPTTTEIGNYAFYNCTLLNSVTFEASSDVVSFGDYSFAQCSKLTNIVIPASTQSVGSYAFQGDIMLATVSFADGGDSLTLGNYVFSECVSLTSVYLPATLTAIELNIFDGCENIEGVYVDEANEYFTSVDEGVLYDKNLTEILFYPKVRGNYTLPSTVTTIGAGAFAENQVMTSITIPKTVTLIKANAFYRCLSLTEIIFEAGGTDELTLEEYAFASSAYVESLVLPDRLKVIGDYAFDHVVSLGTLTFGTQLTSIGAGAFAGTSVTSIVIPDTVTEIGEQAFDGCESLTSITLPANETISGAAFSNCPELATVVIPEGVKYIADQAFANCSALVNITLPAGLISIGEQAFYNCTSLTYINVPNTVTFIGKAAFSTCTSLLTVDFEFGGEEELVFAKTTSLGEKETVFYKTAIEEIVFPARVTTFPYAFFYQYTNFLRKVSFEEGSRLTTIGERAFVSVRTLEEIELPEGLESIGVAAFWSSSATATCSLKSVTIPSTVTFIGKQAFCNQTSLSTVIFKGTSENEGLVISDTAFSNCPIVSVTLPANLISLSMSAFENCAKLEHVEIAGDASYLSVVDGVYYTADKTSLVYAPAYLTGTVTVPETVVEIPAYAFRYSKLSQIILPEGIETIGSYAFANSGITSLAIPSSVTSIGAYAFGSCTALTTVTFAENCQITDFTSVFRTSSIQTIEIPASVTNLSYAFYQCKSLKTVTFAEGSQLKTVTSNAFSLSGATTGLTVILPSGVTEIAASAFGGSSAANAAQLLSITIPNTVTSIVGGAFKYCTKLTSVIFEEGGEEPLVFEDGTYNSTMSNGAFSGCTGLTSITLPERLTKIGKWTFHKCTGLVTINFAENGDLTAIEDGAFYGCTKIASVVFPEGLTTLGRTLYSTAPTISTSIGTFGGCTSLTSVTIPTTLPELLLSQFMGCTKLANISVAEGSPYFKSVDGVLYTADGLTLVYYPAAKADKTLNIPEGVTTIAAYSVGGRGSAAGNYATNLTTVTIPASVTTIEDFAFRYIKTITSVTFAENSKLTSLGQFAFGACTALTSISLPESLKELPVSVFNGCSKLASVVLPSKLEAIGNTAFSGCTVLASITLPGTLRTLGTGIFTNCSALTSVELPDGITEITGSMFSGCTKLTSVYIPDTVTSIGASAFNKCSSLAEISIPDKVTTIGSSAFSGCSALTEITLPSRLEGILASTFATCTKLQSIVIPSSVTLIGNLAFSGCSALEGIEIPYSVESIGVNAFLNCTSLVEVYISEGVTSIGNTAFSGCTNLEYIFIPGTVTTIGTNAFLNCAKISFDLAGDNTDYAVDDSGVLFDSAKTTLIYFPKNVTGEYALPDTVTTISANAFLGSSLTKVVIPAGVTEIPANAFQNSLSLKEVVLPDRIATIGNYAFSGCTALESITIGRFVTSIGSYAFDGCTKLASVTFTANGNDVLTIGDYAFRNCTSLEAVQIPRRVRNRVSYSATGATTSVTRGIGNYAFYGCTKLATVTFEQTGAWLLTEYLAVGDYAFFGCAALKAIEFPNYLGTNSVSSTSATTRYKSIGNYCFAGCTLLSDVRFNRVSSTNYLGEYAFKDCTSLVSIDLTLNKLYLESGTAGATGLFSGCTSLKEVTISAFGWSASNVFEGCTALETVRVVDNSSLASIPAGAFEGFTSLKSVVIESNITKINARTFKGCTSLTSLVIPETVTAIYANAFEGSGITSIHIPKFVTSIDSTAFLNCTALTEITVDSGNAKYCSVDGVLFDKDMTTVICCPAGKVEASYALPDGVTAIGDYAFSGCTSIGSITIAETTVSVGANAFDGWTETQKIDVGFTEAPEGWDSAWDAGCDASVSWKEAPEESTDPDDGEGGDEGAEDSPEDSAEDAA